MICAGIHGSGKCIVKIIKSNRNNKILLPKICEKIFFKVKGKFVLIEKLNTKKAIPF